MKITIEQINELKGSYHENMISLQELEDYIDEYGMTDEGLGDPTESFEQGWNNALEYVFRTLVIEY